MYRLMVITDRRAARGALEDVMRKALAGGADAVQLRERDLEGRELVRMAETLRRITDDAGAALIVNHRVDVALAVEADGVQLGWRSLPPAEVRCIAGDRLKIGVSCHNAEDLAAARTNNADYVILGPVFPTPSKEGLVAPLTVEGFRRCADGFALPVIAVGGITPENAASVRAAGAFGLAVIGAILRAEDPCAAAEALRGE